MTTQDYIDNNETNTLKKGDIVKMINCVEAQVNQDVQWICQTTSFKDKGGDDVVFLEGFSGYFLCEYLDKIEVQWYNIIQIKNLVFTQEFLNGNVKLTDVFEKLDFDKYSDNLDVYENGRMLNCTVFATEQNKEVLSEVIKNFTAFFRYQEAENGRDNRYINLATITEFMADNKLGYVKYNRATDKLYYDHKCTDF